MKLNWPPQNLLPPYHYGLNYYKSDEIPALNKTTNFPALKILNQKIAH
jgi:hypothetical protein